MDVNDKPFYLRQPWEILFRETKLDKISPWNVNLVHLLTTLLEEMNRVGIDFRMAGTAINSSVLIFLKKAELLLKMEEPPEVPTEKQEVYLPPPLNLPFRFEFTTTTISDLIMALEKALSEERNGKEKSRFPTLPPPLPDFMNMEAYLLEIEERAESLLKKIKLFNISNPSLKMSMLLEEHSWIEIVRVFMILLFLAQRGDIDLYQGEDESNIDIRISD